MKHALGAAVAALTMLCAACTPGAAGNSPAGGSAAATVIKISLTEFAPVDTLAGRSGGFAPAVTTVAVGTTVRFSNVDGFAHTATLIPGATVFPAVSGFHDTAQNSSGTTISQPWSSGALQAGTSSQDILIDRPGTYLYGCLFHYGAPMRGTIVAQ